MGSSPAISEYSIAVAASEKLSTISLGKLEINDEIVDFQYIFEIDPQIISIGYYETDLCEKFSSKSVNSDFIVLDRGKCSVEQQVKNVENSPFKGFILILESDNYDPFPYVYNKDAIFVTKSSGAIFKSHKTISVLPDKSTIIAEKYNGQPAGFSAYGLSPDLRIKPDIMAPGNNINAPVPLFLCDDGNCYMRLSGSCMATAYISGVAALYVEMNKSTKGFKKQIMTTARPILGKNERLHSVARQGGGMVKF